MSFLKNKNGLLVLALTIIVLVNSIWSGFYLDTPIRLLELLGFLGYVVVLLFWIFSPRNLFYPLVVVLSAATFGIVDLTLPYSFSVRIGPIYFDVVFTLLLVVLLVRNKEVFSTNKAVHQQRMDEYHEKLVTRFTEKFEDLSDDQIESKLQFKLSPPAIEALRAIQKKRSEENE